jgi:hypothetical protein
MSHTRTEHFNEEQHHAAALADTAIEVRFLTDTIHYLQGILSHKRGILKAALEARGHKSSTTLVRGATLKLTPFEVPVCTCHWDDALACPAVLAGVPTSFEIRVNGTYLSIDFDADFLSPIEPYDGPAPVDHTAAPLGEAA